MLATSTSIAAEIASGDSLTPPQLARRINTHPSTVARWLLRGIPDGQGGLIRLEALRRGRVWLTSIGAYQRFLERHPVNDIGIPKTIAPCGRTIASDRTPSQRERACRDAAEAPRKRHGI